jgi:SSS family solute:Na+ symporter
LFSIESLRKAWQTVVTMGSGALHLTAADFAIIACYLAAVVIVGILLSKRASRGINDFFLGNRRIPWWVMGASGTASNLDMTGTMIIVSFFFAMGLQGFWVEMRGGVGLNLAILLVFMGKWLRRSKVMTTAEWMEYRFGSCRGGQAARILSAVSNLVVVAGMIIYFVKGTGKFFAVFLPFSPETCSVLVIAVALAYTAFSGLYGVVYTDVLQEIIIITVAILVTVKALFLPEHAEVLQKVGPFWQDVSYPTSGRIVEGINVEAWLGGHAWMIRVLGIVVFFSITRNVLEGFGGFSGGYMPQRYYAARDERSAGLLTAEWTGLLAIRWALIASLALLGLWVAQTSPGLRELLYNDPEKTLPVVLGKVLPTGLKGLAVSGLIAAAMSTFDSTINAGAAYWVRDIYQRYIRPHAQEKELVHQSWLASFVITVVSVVLALRIKNINEIWTWITGPLSAGLFAPLIMRWYWDRFNGYGFALATGVGLVASIMIKALRPDLPLHYSFTMTLLVSLAAGVAGALLTPPVEKKVLETFYRDIRPFGLWRRARSKMLTAFSRRAAAENRRDLLNLPFAVGCQLGLFLAVIYFVFHNWSRCLIFLTVSLGCGLVLYFHWYRRLAPPERDGPVKNDPED